MKNRGMSAPFIVAATTLGMTLSLIHPSLSLAAQDLSGKGEFATGIPAGISPLRGLLQKVAAPQDSSSLDKLNAEMGALYKRAAPSVMTIFILNGDQTTLDQYKPAAEQDPEMRGKLPDPAKSGPMAFKGHGSGFIISPKGLVITNFHVAMAVPSKHTALVGQLGDGKTMVPLVPLAASKELDLVLLAIGEKGVWPTAPLGDSSKLAVGSMVFALGTPLDRGLQSTFTMGTVNGVDRVLTGQGGGSGLGSAVSYIQSTTVINPGNSGGPLFDSHGEVIGVNDEILTQDGMYNGVGLSIPINQVKDFVAKALTSLSQERQGQVAQAEPQAQ